jgi:hypothetical protein
MPFFAANVSDGYMFGKKTIQDRIGMLYFGSILFSFDIFSFDSFVSLFLLN